MLPNEAREENKIMYILKESCIKIVCGLVYCKWNYDLETKNYKEKTFYLLTCSKQAFSKLLLKLSNISESHKRFEFCACPDLIQICGVDSALNYYQCCTYWAFCTMTGSYRTHFYNSIVLLLHGFYVNLPDGHVLCVTYRSKITALKLK